MYLSILKLVFLISIISESIDICLSWRVHKFTHLQKTQQLKSVPDWLVETPNQEEEDTISVRFINGPSRKDVLANSVKPGSNLLAVGDSVGVQLPRACRTGLCASCTCEVEVPELKATGPNTRDGFATVRACQVKCFVPDGMKEMVVDVSRMRKIKKGDSSKDPTATVADAQFSDPMARFSGDWEREFRPMWDQPDIADDQRILSKKLRRSGMTKAAVELGPGGDPKRKKSICKDCAGTGRVQCYACEGAGVLAMDGYGETQCATCVGLTNIGCGTCRATGINTGKSERGSYLK